MLTSAERCFYFNIGGLDEVGGSLQPQVDPNEGDQSGGGSSSSAVAGATGSGGWLTILSLDYYQSFFDVTTAQVDWLHTIQSVAIPDDRLVAIVMDLAMNRKPKP